MGRGRRRLVEPALLLRLRGGPSHGYSLVASLEELDLGGFDPSVVYRLLRDLEEEGWVWSTWDEQDTQGPPRRVYALTDSGEDALGRWMEELEASRARIMKLLSEYEKGG